MHPRTLLATPLRRIETFLVISNASTLFSHKVKKFGNICSKMKIEAAFEYI